MDGLDVIDRLASKACEVRIMPKQGLIWVGKGPLGFAEWRGVIHCPIITVI